LRPEGLDELDYKESSARSFPKEATDRRQTTMRYDGFSRRLAAMERGAGIVRLPGGELVRPGDEVRLLYCMMRSDEAGNGLDGDLQRRLEAWSRWSPPPQHGEIAVVAASEARRLAGAGGG